MSATIAYCDLHVSFKRLCRFVPLFGPKTAFVWPQNQGCGVGGKISDPNSDLSKISDSLTQKGMKFGCKN